MKFLPTYRLGVEGTASLVPVGSDDTTPPAVNLTITPPYTCEFEICRASASSSQTATFRLYNLAKETRDQIQKDWFNIADIRALQFSAGYIGESLSLLFNGTVKQAQSYRRRVDVITEIQGWDGASAMANGYSLRSIAGGVVFSDLIKTLASDLPGLNGAPIVGQFPSRTKRGSVFAGNTWQYILQLSQGLAIIDNGQLKVLNQDEVIRAEIPTITSATGMLETPVRANAMIKVPILFEPRLTVGQIVSLQSQINPVYNGIYKVMGFTHRGTISPAVEGTPRTTEVTLWDGLKSVGGFKYVSGQPAGEP